MPEGFVAVIRCVTGFSASSFAPETGQVTLGHSSVTVWYAEFSPEGLSDTFFYRTDELRVVVEATDHILVSSGPDVDISVSGYLLSLP